jgi:hypothetical protein
MNLASFIRCNVRVLCLALLLPGLVMGLHAQTAHFSYTQLTLASSGFGDPNGIAMDGSGNVFVADSGGNAVYEIPSGCTTSSCVKTLGSGFSGPEGVAVDRSGNVFVADTFNTSVKEILAAGGYTTVQTLASGFSTPWGVAVDGGGNVFVADSGNSAVKEIPPGCVTASCVKTLGSGFDYPTAVAVDGSGDVFVADTNNTSVKEILAAGGYQTVNTLGGGFNFPYGVAVDGSGNVFVADTFNSAMKEIPPGCITSSCVNSLGSGFLEPFGIAVDGSGNVFVADTFHARVVKLEMANFGMVAIGQTSATIPLTFTFDSGGTIDSPVALTQGAAVLDFAVANGSTCTAGTYSAGNTCTVDATFTPKFAGLRNGAVLLKDGSGNTIATAYVHGIGSGPQVSFLPGSQSTIGSGFSNPQGVAVDANGNVFATYNEVIEFLAAENYTTINTLGISYTNQPTGIAVDGSGNVFVADRGNNAVYEFLVGGGYSGAYPAVITLASGFNNPVGIAVDGSGNVFVADDFNNAVKEILAAGGYTTVQTLASGFHYPEGVAVNASGNVFVADTGNSAVKEILAAGGYSTVNTLGSGFSAPMGVAVDGSGNVFVANGSDSTVLKLDYADAPSLSFGSIDVGVSSEEQTVTLQNIGNAPLTLPVPAGGSNPSITQYFTLDSSAETACPVITTTSAASLASGASCTLAISFDPTIPGNINGSLVMSDNALNNSSATQTIALQGTGITQQSQTITVGTRAPSSAAYKSTFRVAATASSGLTVTYTSSGGCTNNGATYTMTSGTTGCTVQFNQSGNSNYAAAPQVIETVSATLASQAALTVTGVPTTAQVYGITFTVGSSGGSGTGAVTFIGGGACSASGTTVTMTSGTGTCSVTATKATDGNYSATTSAAATVSAAKANQTITVTTAAPSSAAYKSTFRVAATASSGLAVAYTVSGGCTISSGTVTMTSPTTACTVNFNQAGNADYIAAPKQTETVTAAKASQTITVTTAAPSSAAYNSKFTVAATASSGLAVAYTSSGGCTNSGATFTMTSGSTSCTVQFNQAGNADYNAASPVTETVTAAKASQTITFANPGVQTYGVAPITLKATASSGLAVSYSVTAGPATVSGSVLTITGAGSVTVQASQTGNGNYAAATAVSVTFTVYKATSTAKITSETPNPSTVNEAVTVDFTVSGTGGVPTGAVTVSSGIGGPTCTATLSAGAGNCSLTITTTGSKTLTASYAGDTNFNRSTSATVTLVVQP